MSITALYVRVSTNAQAEEGYSIDAQKEKLIQWCNLKDHKDYRVYEDGGWSGSNIDRPALKQLIADCMNHLVSRVVVYKLDRLSRSQRDTLYLFEDVFIANNVEFISLNESLDTSTPYGMAMVGILSSFAQLERQNIRMRTRMGMRERVKDGYWMGGARTPFGYDYDASKNILVPNEHAEDVREIYDLYLKGYSATKLSSMYNLSGDNHVTAILDRITYTGKISYNGEILQGRHEPIIDDDTWLRVQEERSRRSKRGIQTSQYLLSGLLVCGKCGAKMRYQKWSSGRTRICCYSQIPSSKPYLIKDPNCDNAKCFAEDVEPVVLEDLFSITDLITVDLSNVKQTGEDSSRISSAVKTLQNRYDIISAKIKRLYNLYAESENEILLETITENQEELSKLSSLIEHEKSSASALSDIAQRNETIYNLRTRWDAMTLTEKRTALSICIDKIIITNGEIEMFYNI